MNKEQTLEAIKVMIKPTEGAYQKPKAASIVRQTKTLFIVRPDDYTYNWTFSKSDMLRTGDDKHRFPRWKLVLQW